MKPEYDFHDDRILTVWSASAVQRIGMMGSLFAIRDRCGFEKDKVEVERIRGLYEEAEVQQG